MKQVLLIDESNVFRDFLKHKLDSCQTIMEIGLGQPDSLSKMRSLIPDLVIIDYNSAESFIVTLLEQKKKDPNAVSIPVLVLAQKIDSVTSERLTRLGVKWILPKPLKIDQLLSIMSDVLKCKFEIDTTPCILEAHVNDNILFIEIAQGLNREKIDLLKYSLRELIALYNLTSPKVLIMMTDLSLSFVDGPNLELLLDTILENPSVRKRNVKVLTMDSFAKDFIEGNSSYSEIQAVADLSKAIDSLLKDVNPIEDASTVISERILAPAREGKLSEASFEMRFKSEIQTLKTVGKNIRIAVVDDDVVIRSVLTKTFLAIQANVDQFESGVSFLPQGLSGNYDLIFLDLMMPVMNGFEVLQKLKESGIQTPIIVLSAISQREAVIKVLSSGVKSYMVKPLKPEQLLKKAIEVLQAV
ncbi:MAG: response regulator [Spirochaetales bacterium]|nr:response regulator [Spirochaetales bacterium]